MDGVSPRLPVHDRFLDKPWRAAILRLSEALETSFLTEPEAIDDGRTHLDIPRGSEQSSDLGNHAHERGV